MHLIILPTLLASLAQLSNAAEIGACAISPTPDFSAPGRRISEQKCREYNFARKQIASCTSPGEDLITEYPYMGAIGFKKVNQTEDTDYHFLCTAFLISPNFALTVAHCIARPPNGYNLPEIVRLGHTNIMKADVSRVDIKIISRVAHPNYSPPKKSFDIGLLQLESNIPWSKSIQPACLWTKNDVGTGRKEVPSWGHIVYPEIEHYNGDLRVITVEPMDSATCEGMVNYNRMFEKLEDHHLCANENGSLIAMCSLRGTAGAPIINKVHLDELEDQMPYAMAITSFGYNCHPGVGIGIYTRVSSFLDWIEQTVWPQQS